MEDSDGISSDEVEGTQEELDELIKELEQHEETFRNFTIKGFGMSGDSTHGFSYDP
jgi:hypothetical protein